MPRIAVVEKLIEALSFRQIGVVVEIQSHSASLPVANIQAKKNCCVMPKFQGCEPNGRLRAIA